MGRHLLPHPIGRVELRGPLNGGTGVCSYRRDLVICTEDCAVEKVRSGRAFGMLRVRVARGRANMSLRETLERMEETEKATKQVVDAKLKEWRETAIPSLCQSVREMLSDLIADGLVVVNPLRTERRTEQLTGPYEIEVMDLVIRGRTITLNP